MADAETEQLWARQLDEHRFEILLHLVLVFDLALGDVVGTGGDYLVRRVVEPSVRFVFPVGFGESFHPRDEIAEELKRRGALIERSSVNLLAIDAENELRGSPREGASETGRRTITSAYGSTAITS